MAAQLCGRCGGFRTDGGCACPSGPDDPTTVIPAVPATAVPQLVRPYINPTDLLVDENLDAAADPRYETSVVPGIDAPHTVRSTRARVLAGQLVKTPGARGAEPGAFPPGGRITARRTSGGAGAAGAGAAGTGGGAGIGGDQGRGGRGRRAALIVVGALAVAGLGTAAALAPRMMESGDGNQAQPLPGVTLALPTTAPDPSSAAAHNSPAAVRTTHPVRPTTTRTRATAGSTPSAATSAPQHGNAPNSPPPATTPGSRPPSTAPSGSQTLQLGDSGAAVSTLQSELVSLYVDQNLDVTGTYDQETQHAVAVFQWWYNVQGDPSGVFGPHSQARMNRLMHH